MKRILQPKIEVHNAEEFFSSGQVLINKANLMKQKTEGVQIDN